MRLILTPFLLLFALTACGGDSPSGPSDAEIGGAWRISYTNMSGAGLTCNTPSAANVAVSQSGASFTGSYGPLTLRCTDGVTTVEGTFQGVIANGTVDVNAVAFDLDTQDFHQTGTVNGASMSGTARWVVDLGGGGTVTLNGNWSAVRP
jgi:hypothetical protein